MASNAPKRPRRMRLPTPDAELDRRWQRVRESMERDGVDVLLIHNHVDAMGGYVRYFCDLSTGGGYPLSIVFPREGPMTLIAHGPQGSISELSPTEDPLLYGVERILMTWSFQTAVYTAGYDAEQIVLALRPYARSTIGLVGFAQMPYALLTHVKEQLPDARMLDASELVDAVKAIKSPYELEALARTIELQVAAFEAALDAIAPGRTEWEVAAAGWRVARERGSEHGILRVGAGPQGEPTFFKPQRQQLRALEPGDRLTILVEPAGPDEFYAELGRTIVVGSADDALLEEHEFAIGAWRHCAAMLVPGASAAAVAVAYNAHLHEHDRPEERRIHCHGQGYDIVERPLVRADESMSIEAGMLIALHPMYVRDGAAHWICDNVLIGPDGASAPLHGIEQKVFEV